MPPVEVSQYKGRWLENKISLIANEEICILRKFAFDGCFLQAVKRQNGSQTHELRHRSLAP